MKFKTVVNISSHDKDNNFKHDDVLINIFCPEERFKKKQPDIKITFKGDKSISNELHIFDNKNKKTKINYSKNKQEKKKKEKFSFFLSVKNKKIG